MKIIIQRVKSACVSVDDKIVGAIEHGLCLLVGIEPTDTQTDLEWMAQKVASLRIFSDDTGKMNLSVSDINGATLLVSQFTLLADCTAGRRPSFTGAGNPAIANALFNTFADLMRAQNIPVQTGIFGAEMLVKIENDGPATFILESPKK